MLCWVVEFMLPLPLQSSEAIQGWEEDHRSFFSPCSLPACPSLLTSPTLFTQAVVRVAICSLLLPHRWCYTYHLHDIATNQWSMPACTAHDRWGQWFDAAIQELWILSVWDQRETVAALEQRKLQGWVQLFKEQSQAVGNFSKISNKTFNLKQDQEARATI